MPSASFKAAQELLSQKWSPEAEMRIQQTLRSTGDDDEAETDVMRVSGPESRFDREDDEAWLRFLDEHGYVVIAGVLDGVAVDHAQGLLWQYLEQQGMKKSDPSTWLECFPGDSSTGICPQAGAPHSEFAWFVRSHPSVSKVFEKVWNESDLITSFDAINVFRPFVEHPELKTKGGWLHLDQNSYPPGRGKSGKHCIQGLVTLLDANTTTGSLCVVPGSQLRHEELCNKAKCATGDFVPLQHNGVQLADIFRGSAPTMVCAEAGDLILWDSRTVHANTPALEVTHAPHELLRMVCYTCMTPRAWASDLCIRERQKAFERKVGGTHWPHEFKARDSLDGEITQTVAGATECIRALIGECAPIQQPSAEAMAAMEKANELESEGDLAGAKEWLDKAVALGHNCLQEFGGWK